MAKKKNSSKQKTDRNKVNFNNAKAKKVIAYMQLGENRISRAEFMEIAGKDIYYKLKSNNYIKENAGTIKATPKLQKHINKMDGSNFSSSSSSSHAKAIRSSLHLLPDSVLTSGNFTSGYDTELRYKKSTKSKTHQERLTSMKQTHLRNLSGLNTMHRDFLRTSHNERQRFEHEIRYQKMHREIVSSLKRLEKEVCLTPDYSIRFQTRDEYEQYIQNLERYRDEELKENTRAHSLVSDSIYYLKGIEYTAGMELAIEIVTKNYGEREIELHKNYSALTDTPQIFLM